MISACIGQPHGECSSHDLLHLVASNRLPLHIHRGLAANTTIAPKCVLVLQLFVTSSHDSRRTRLRHRCACSGDRPLDSLRAGCLDAPSIIPLLVCPTKNDPQPAGNGVKEHQALDKIRLGANKYLHDRLQMCGLQEIYGNPLYRS